VFVATGGHDPSVASHNEDCTDWTTTTGITGIGYVYSTVDWFALGADDCTRPDYSIYCLQE
jgi:hypothetical protein